MAREYKPRSSDARKFLNAMDQRKSREVAAKTLEAVLSDEEIKARLKLKPQDLEVLDDIIQNPKRYSGNQLLALKLKIAATVAPPKQEVGVDGVQVVVNTFQYTAPETATATIEGIVPQKPLLEDGEDEDAVEN